MISYWPIRAPGAGRDDLSADLSGSVSGVLGTSRAWKECGPMRVAGADSLIVLLRGNCRASARGPTSSEPAGGFPCDRVIPGRLLAMDCLRAERRPKEPASGGWFRALVVPSLPEVLVRRVI